jgi:hypothetical protein
MLLSFALYGGLILIAAAAVLVLIRRTRKLAGFSSVVGVLMIAIAIAWPAREERVTTPGTHLDEAMPVWQFAERHATHISAPPQRVFDAIRRVTASEILFFRALTAIRRFGRPGREDILNAPEHLPLLDVATRTSFRYLADDPPREIVVGTIVVPPNAAVATMNFLVTPDATGSVLSTETRVFARNASARRRFAIYWRVIHPGSDIIRRMWLRAIKRRAESSV